MQKQSTCENFVTLNKEKEYQWHFSHGLLLTLNNSFLALSCRNSTHNSPIQATHIPPRARDNGPPHVRNFSSGAQAEVSDNAATVPAVYAAARKTNGPPSNIMGAITNPTMPLCAENKVLHAMSH